MKGFLINQQMFCNSQTIIQEATHKPMNPSAKFNKGESMDEYKISATHSFGPKIANAIGKQIAKAVYGSYRRSMISFFIFFNKVMKVILNDEAARRTGQPSWLTGFCFFMPQQYFRYFSDGSLLGWDS
jgi:hypothetical protein